MNHPRPFADSADLLAPGISRRLYQIVKPAVEQLLGVQGVNGIYRKLQRPGITPQQFCEEALNLLGSTVIWPNETELGSLREWQGPLVVMANHPLGATDALALMLFLERIRPGGWRMLANQTLARCPELAPHLIAVEPFDPAAPANRRGLLQARRFLAGGRIVAAFPAGRVSGWNPQKTHPLDPPWSDHLARLATASGAAIALIHFTGHNGSLFMKIPMKWPRLRAIFLAREIMRRDKPPLRIYPGPLLPPDLVTKLARSGNIGGKFRARCYLIPEISLGKPTQDTHQQLEKNIAPPGSPENISKEITALSSGSQHLFDQSSFTALFFQKLDAPHLFHELSRQREIAFRASGQGGGGEVDVTPEDDYYHQLILWDREQNRLIGAYRLGFSSDVIQTHGVEALYLSHVFHIDPDFFRKMGSGVELTRSFVRPEYQGNPLALALLWRGLGQVVAGRPDITNLFGSVTVPATVSTASQGILVDFLQHNHSDDSTMRTHIRARTPFSAPGHAHRLVSQAHCREPIESLRDAIRRADGTPHRIPPLIRHYLSLNAKFIDFHVEKDFGNALYCLLRVDLRNAPLPHLRRFLGKTAAARLHADSPATVHSPQHRLP